MMLLLLFLLTLYSLTEAVSRLTETFVSFKNLNDLLANNVSSQCLLDVTTLSKSLAEFVSTAKSCIKQGGCVASQKEILQKNMYAAKQLDAFGKLPAGIMELTTVSTGSYVECNEVHAPYETHYCFVMMHSNNCSAHAMVEKLTVKLAVCMPRSCNEQQLDRCNQQFHGTPVAKSFCLNSMQSHTLPRKQGRS
ncbi:hypothetical protein KIN20_022854 [Parelaphostrongylus tenuis]|uniref:Nose resistant-to-fluoxetine protein N-terminal domain-containing protein n=1 Tax=Parelaphostrongylus tenuis TaxID=148309 RepID=A0AAD5QVN0_PARTN|nr:hypothetical protein KIN20_022854 [Parelaphostrongylus tenuis]